MDKRGQFYILLVVIISLGIFAINIRENKVEEAILFEDFNDISLNYATEAPKVVNYAIYSYSNVSEVLPGFTSDFLLFVRLRNPTVSLIYVYNDGKNLTLKSYLNETTLVNSIDNSTLSLLGSEEALINDINLKVAGKDFTHTVPLQVRNFGDEFSTSQLPFTDNLILNIGGIFHNFDLSQNAPELQVLLKSTNGNIIQIYKTGSSSNFPVRF